MALKFLIPLPPSPKFGDYRHVTTPDLYNARYQSEGFACVRVSTSLKDVHPQAKTAPVSSPLFEIGMLSSERSRLVSIGPFHQTHALCLDAYTISGSKFFQPWQAWNSPPSAIAPWKYAGMTCASTPPRPHIPCVSTAWP